MGCPRLPFAAIAGRRLRALASIGLAAGLLLFQSPTRALPQTAPAGPAFQVADMNTHDDHAAGSYPSNMSAVGSLVFFTAWNDPTGVELWKSDGTAAGTSLVKDINPGQAGSEPRNLVNFGGMLFFSADDGQHSRELWKSDGTMAGTVLVKDLNPTPELPSNPTSLINLNGTPFFFASDRSNGTALWKSDGTAAGTTAIKSLPPNQLGPTGLTHSGGVLFFQLSGQLWKSDGTPAGTAPFTTQSLDAIESLTDVNGTLFFVASDGPHGKEIWKSNGTAAGTTMIADLLPSWEGSDPRQLLNVNGTLFFVALYPISGSTQRTFGLFKTDGVTVTRVTLDGTGPDSSAGGKIFAYVNGTLFFNGGALHGAELWRTDGTPAGTTEVKDIVPGIDSSDPAQLTDVNGILYFIINAGIGSGINHRPQLWKSDGTANGTLLVKDLAQVQLYDFPSGLFNLNGTLLFTESDPSFGRELSRSDGTAAGTTLVADIGVAIGASNPTNLINVGETLYFVADDGQHGPELWKSDGTVAGTTLVKDINPDQVAESAKPENLTNVQGKLFFTAYSGPIVGLWVSDGMAAGTILLHSGGPYASLRNVNGTLYFAIASDLWKSDGTQAGTVLVRRLVAPSPGYFANISEIANKAGAVLFGVEIGPTPGLPLKQAGLPAADADIPGLWRSDGSLGGTTLVKQFGQNFRLTNFTEANGTLFFLVNYGQLWRSDGTTAGTVLVMELPSERVASRLTNAAGILFFMAPPRHDLIGTQLWKSDGTLAGTIAIKEFGYNYNCGDNIDVPLTHIDGTVFLAGDDPATGCELWKSDGTIAGTTLVQDVVAGPYSSYPLNVRSVAGQVLFAADDVQAGWELWSSQEADVNTARLQDIAPGPLASRPEQFTRAGQFIFFRATDGSTGNELWAMPLSTFLNKYSRVALMRR